LTPVLKRKKRRAGVHTGSSRTGSSRPTVESGGCDELGRDY
jgi:hypothetical protein